MAEMDMGWDSDDVDSSDTPVVIATPPVSFTMGYNEDPVWDPNCRTFPAEDKYALSSIGFDVAGYVGEGSYGKVFNGICNEKASKSYEVQTPVGFDGTKLWNTGRRQMRDVSLHGRTFAIKWLRPQPRRNVLEEAAVLMDLNHPNVVEVFFVTKMQYKNSYIIMEYLNGKTLKEQIDGYRSKKRFFSEPDFKNMFIDLIEGLKYLHSKRVVHKDIHGLNLMFENFDPKDSEVIRILKYVDFNLAKDMSAFPDDMFDAYADEDIRMLSYVFDRIQEMTKFIDKSFETEVKKISLKMKTNRKDYRNIAVLYTDIMNVFANTSRRASFMASTSSANN